MLLVSLTLLILFIYLDFFFKTVYVVIVTKPNFPFQGGSWGTGGAQFGENYGEGAAGPVKGAMSQRDQKPYSRGGNKHHQTNHRENMSVKCIPLRLHFYVEKLGFAGVYLIFLFLIQNIDCWYTLEWPR